MTIQVHRRGERLAYVVVPQEGTVLREKVLIEPRMVNGKPALDKDGKPRGIVFKRKMVEEPAGYLVYFPRGHVLRIRDKSKLAHYGLDREAPIVSSDDLLRDPNSAYGQLIRAQDDPSRRKAMESIEKMTIRLATAKTGDIKLDTVKGNAHG